MLPFCQHIWTQKEDLEDKFYKRITVVLSRGGFFFYKFIYLFIIFGGVGSALLGAGFLQLWRAGATLHCGARASHCSGFSCCRARALGARASVVVARGLSSCVSWALERRLSSCGARAQLLRGMWDLPRPGIKPVCPALAGGFLTTVPPGKPQKFLIKLNIQGLPWWRSGQDSMLPVQGARVQSLVRELDPMCMQQLRISHATTKEPACRS